MVQANSTWNFKLIDDELSFVTKSRGVRYAALLAKKQASKKGKEEREKAGKKASESFKSTKESRGGKGNRAVRTTHLHR